MSIQAKTNRSQAYFNAFNLSFYDVVVSFVSPYAWRCPLTFLDKRYQQFVSNNHLEIGPGTGYFLNRSGVLKADARLALMDLSEACLQKSAKTLERYHPQTYRQNILEPISSDIEAFDSIGINYVFHCVPGSFEQKGQAFKHLATLLKPGGVIFGCSVLALDGEKNLLAKAALKFLQSSGIFNNQADSLQDLTKALESHFVDVKVEMRGPTAVFSARRAQVFRA